MWDFNSTRWRIKLRTRRKKNWVKRINNEEVMAVSVKTGRAGNMQVPDTNLLENGLLRATRGSKWVPSRGMMESVFKKLFFFQLFCLANSFKHVLSYV
ncbi:hypothetical protein HanPSC8_Chr06g0242751 [Helianthus annuus]|nr:hypothetical protein HanPSC8_Chr06g0242751 [Helianthus annuus]